MLSLRDLFSPRAQLLAQQRRIRSLEREVEQLQLLNVSMREGMRRCVSCEYRIDFKNRQGQFTPGDTNKDSPP
ncbi:MAG: hypothetical protein V7700_09040 [Halioglobus sp.]